MEIVVGGGGDKLYSQNLRDFLRIKEEDHQRNLNQASSSSIGGGSHRSSGLTLSAVLGEKFGQPPPVEEPPLQQIQSNRTLLDIIREDQASGLCRGRGDGRSSWRHLRNKIRLLRRDSGTAWSSAVPITSSDALLSSNNIRRSNSNIDSGEFTRGPSSRRNPSRATGRSSGRFEQTSRRSVTENNQQYENEEEEYEHGGDAVEGSVEQPVRMSLMALLAENDIQNGSETSAYTMDEDVLENAGAGDAVSGVAHNSCCVCMVRHKGAAFIPCGHTFCRLCSRELWVQRGNCPLCNNHILEILDIF